jgi:phosphoserine aminotransferase
MGPAGCTLVILRDDLLKKAQANPAYEKLPIMMQYGPHVADKSLHNTPPAFSIYIMNLVTRWLIALGGLEPMEKLNTCKANRIYNEIDRTGFFRGHARKEDRSLMNITFRLPNEALEEKFVKESKAAGLDGLKGHRSVGGLRASIYNAFPMEGVVALVDFMKNFEQKNG